MVLVVGFCAVFACEFPNHLGSARVFGGELCVERSVFFFHLPSCPVHSSHSLTLDRSYTLPLTTTQQSSADECLAISATGTLEPSRCAMMLVAACIS